MPIVQSAGALRSFVDVPTLQTSAASVGNSPWLMVTYGYIYARQQNIRTCVDFLSRNIAQLGIGVFRRVSDTDREHLPDHDVARWLSHPNGATTRYRLIESLIADLGIYFNAYWYKVRTIEQGRLRVRLVRLPPAEMRVFGGLLPSGYRWSGVGREPLDIVPDDLVTFGGYNPFDPKCGLSPIDTLRPLLEEDAAATTYREAFWRNAARMEGVIERPKDAPKWTPAQKQEWRKQWMDRFAGPENAGMIPVLEDGMAWKNTSHNAVDSEYAEARKLSREDCARAYHIPLPLVGILDHATFSNIKEQHKQLYSDTLGPWLEMVQAEIEMSIVPESPDNADIYVEFNIAEKLKGSFEEQAAALQASVGRPIMTANEGRARLNLPSIKDDPTADELAAQQGGPSMSLLPASPSTPPPRALMGEVIDVPAISTPTTAIAAAVRDTWQRQKSRLGRVAAADRAEALDYGRGMRELAAALTPLLGPTRACTYASSVTLHTYALLKQGADPFTAAREVPPCPIE
jgi:HK97 family phage portal protein